MQNFSLSNCRSVVLQLLPKHSFSMVVASIALLAWLVIDAGTVMAAIDGRMTYSANSTTPQHRTYADATNTFAAGAATILGAVPTFVVQKTAPTRNERLVGYVTTGGQLYIVRWNGTAWTNEWNIAVGGAGVDGRRFDISYEKTTGRAMVVYSRNVATTNELAYRTWSGTAWSAATNLDSARITGIATAIELLARPTTGSNEIALSVVGQGTATANSAQLSTLIWSGSAWGNEPTTAHATNMPSVITTGNFQNSETFDMAYEGLSGDLFVVLTSATPQQWYRTYSAGTWGTVTSYGTARLVPLQMVAVGNPYSNEVLVAFNRSADGRVYGNVWTGTAVGTTTTVGTTGTTATAINKKHFAGGWVRSGSTDAAVVVWASLTATLNTINYNYFTGGAWGTEASVATTRPGAYAWMDADTDDSTMMLTFSDANNDLFAKRCVFTAPSTFTWANADGGAALMTTLTNATTQNFDFSYNIDFTPPTEGTLSITSTNTGTFLSSPLTFQETFTEAESAVKSCEYTTDDATWNAGTVSGTSPNFTCTTSTLTVIDGEALVLKMRATSKGGVSNPVNNQSRVVDAVAPTTATDYPGGSSPVDVNVTLSATDGAGVGGVSILYCQDTLNSCIPATTYTAPVAVTGTAAAKTIKYLRYSAKDALNNTETVTSTTITIDKRSGTEVGLLSFSGVSYDTVTVSAIFGGDLNANNTCIIKWGTSLGTYPNTATAVRSASKYTATINTLAENTMYYFQATFADADTILAGTNPALGSQKTIPFPVGHNSTLTGSTKWAGNWGGGGGKYGAFTCATCHDDVSNNIKLIKTPIATPDATNWASSNSVSVAVTANAIDFGTDNLTHTTSVKACEVCHSQTYIHKYNQTTAEKHGDVPDCMSCHKHDGGFTVGGSCERCHDLNAPNTRAPKVVNKTGALYNGEAYGSHLKAFKSDVLSTGTNWDTQCRQCHGLHTGTVQIPNNTAVGINYTIHNGIWLGGTATTMTTEAEICWECHDQAANSVSEWGANSKQTASTNVTQYDYGDLYTDTTTSTGTKTSNWTTGFWRSGKGRTSTDPFYYKRGRIQSTHSANTTGVTTVSGANYLKTETRDTVDKIRCTYCHDVHNVLSYGGTLANGATNVAGKPYLRGSWFSNPYEEDGAPQTGVVYSNTQRFGAVPRGNGAAQTYLGGFYIDINNVQPGTATKTANGTAAANPTTGWTYATSASLCMTCHGATVNTMDYTTGEALWLGTNGHANAVIGGTGTGAANIFENRGGTAGANVNPLMHFNGTTGGGTGPGESTGIGYRNNAGTAYNIAPLVSPTGEISTATFNVNNWGTMTYDDTTINTSYHKFSCSKCHNPHASRLPKLMITNCLDTKHNTWDDSLAQITAGTSINVNRSISNWSTAQNCHRLGGIATGTGPEPVDTGAVTATHGTTTDYANRGWNYVTPWTAGPPQ